MLPNIGLSEVLIVLLILVVFFGAKRIPELARSLGSSIRAFKNGIGTDAAKNKGGRKGLPDHSDL